MMDVTSTVSEVSSTLPIEEISSVPVQDFLTVPFTDYSVTDGLLLILVLMLLGGFIFWFFERSFR
ncbi:hypothetical protein [Clostridium merdae]|uniref:hypothetical protein n=1 Tax=Clostridium merdae TaxID=1958780 RepID=UPI00117C555F|nr:hypothetical protein [Clostridium merdae]